MNHLSNKKLETVPFHQRHGFAGESTIVQPITDWHWATIGTVYPVMMVDKEQNQLSEQRANHGNALHGISILRCSVGLFATMLRVSIRLFISRRSYTRYTD